MLTVSVELDGLKRKFDTLAESANDLAPAFRRFGGHLRKAAIARYAAQDFPGLAASTLEKRAAKGLQKLAGKLNYDLKKAKRRAHDARRASGLESKSVILRALKSAVLGDVEDTIAVANSRGVKNRRSVLDEFARRHRGGEGGGKLTNAQTKSLNAREERAVTKAVGAPILGRLPRTLVVTVDRASVTLESRTHMKWTEIHNKGGTAGHGAKIPKRETIKVDNTDLDILKAILVEEMLLPFHAME